MRYVIKCDDYLLHDSQNKILKVRKPKLNLELNKNGTLHFTIYNNHPYYERINKLKSVTSVYQDNKVLFKGRVLDDTMNIYKSRISHLRELRRICPTIFTDLLLIKAIFPNF